MRRRKAMFAIAGMFDSWHIADKALKYWTKQARFVLCAERHGVNCVKP